MLKHYAIEISMVLLFMLGVLIIAYLFTENMAQLERQYNTCIEAGNQYIHGNCVK